MFNILCILERVSDSEKYILSVNVFSVFFEIAVLYSSNYNIVFINILKIPSEAQVTVLECIKWFLCSLYLLHFQALCVFLLEY